MKKLIIFFMFLSTSLLAQDKIGYIDSQRILAEYKGAVDIERRYNEKIEEWKAKAQTMRDDIEKMREQLQTQNMLLSEEAKLRKLKEIESKQQEYQQFIQEIWGQEGKAAELNQQLMQPLLNEIDTLLSRIGEEEDFSIILDAASGAVVYAEDGLDLTERIIEELNRKFMPEEEEVEKVEYYVLDFMEEGSMAKSRDLGTRVKNLIDIAIQGTGGFKEIEPQPLSNAKTGLGIVEEYEVTVDEAKELLRITEGDFMVLGKVRDEGGIIFVDFSVVSGKTGAVVIDETVEMGVEDELKDNVSKKIVEKIISYYK